MPKICGNFPTFTFARKLQGGCSSSGDLRGTPAEFHHPSLKVSSDTTGLTQKLQFNVTYVSFDNFLVETRKCIMDCFNILEELAAINKFS